MTSEIRANTLKNRVGLGTIEYSNTGPVISGITTSLNFKTGTSNLHSTGLNIFDLDVDGHTNLDDVSVAGVTTFASTINASNVNVSGNLSSVPAGDYSLNNWGALTLYAPTPALNFTETDANPDYRIILTGGVLKIQDVTNSLADRFTIGTTGNATFSGIIETTGSEIKITGAEPRLTFTDTDNNPDFQIWANAQRFSIYDSTNSATRLRIENGGQVGVNTSTPENADSMQIFGTTTPLLTIKAGDAGSDTNRRATLRLWTNGNKVYKLEADASDGGLKVLDSSTERLIITSTGDLQIADGNLKLGNNSSSSVNSSNLVNINLGGTYHDTAGSFGKLKLYDDGSDEISFGVSNNSCDFILTSSSWGYNFYGGNSGTTRLMSLNQTGNIQLLLGGSGSASQTYPLTVDLGGTYSSSAGNGNNLSAKLKVWSDGTDLMGLSVSDNQLDYIVTSENYDHVFYGGNAGTTHLMRIEGDGGVGINETSPDRLLHISDSSNGGIIRLTNTSTSISNGTICGMIEFEQRDSNTPGVSANIRAEMQDTTNGANSLNFSTGTPTTIGTRMTIQSNGRINIGGGNSGTALGALHINTPSAMGTETALWVGDNSANRYMTIQQNGSTEQFSHMYLRFDDNGTRPVLQLVNRYATGTGYGTQIQFKGNNDEQTGAIKVQNVTSGSSNADMSFTVNNSDKEVLRLQSGGDARFYNGLTIAKYDNDNSNFTKSGLVLSTPAYTEYQYTWSGQSSYTIDLTCASYFHSEFIYVQHQTNGGTGMQTYIRGKWANNHRTHTCQIHEWYGAVNGLDVTFIASDQSGNGEVNGEHGLTAAGWSNANYRGLYGGGGDNSDGSSSANGRLRITETYNWGSVSSRALTVRVYYGSFSISKS